MSNPTNPTNPINSTNPINFAVTRTGELRSDPFATL